MYIIFVYFSWKYLEKNKHCWHGKYFILWNQKNNTVQEINAFF